MSMPNGIPDEALTEWQVTQTTAKQVGLMIADASAEAVLSCSDMVASYESVPAKNDQRPNQAFQLLGREFVKLFLVIGDKRVCLIYEWFHHCIINFFVIPRAPIRHALLGPTIGDVNHSYAARSKSFH